MSQGSFNSGMRLEESPRNCDPVSFAPNKKKIVRRVDELFSLAEEIEARCKKAKAHVDKLTQSILAKAFRGELVAQHPNAGPASAMLQG